LINEADLKLIFNMTGVTKKSLLNCS